MDRYYRAASSCKDCWAEPSCKRCRTEGKAASKHAISTAASIGSSLGGRILSFFGRGDYNLKANSLVDAGGVVADDLKITYGDTRRETRISYREFVKDIVSDADGNFKIESFSLNPTNQELFPWLSGIANQWEQCKINGIMFEYVSLASDSNTGNRTLGSIMMATDYDIFDNTYLSKREMMNSAYSNEAKVSSHLVHGVECARGETFHPLMFTGTPPAGADPRDYSLGNFQIATQGGATGSEDVLGSLYVHYDITFLKEQIPLGNLEAQASASYIIPFEGNNNVYGADGTANISQFGTTLTVAGNAMTVEHEARVGEFYKFEYMAASSTLNSATDHTFGPTTGITYRANRAGPVADDQTGGSFSFRATAFYASCTYEVTSVNALGRVSFQIFGAEFSGSGTAEARVHLRRWLQIPTYAPLPNLAPVGGVDPPLILC